MQVATTEQVMRMREALQALCDDIGAFLNSESILPRAGSLAAVELTEESLADQLLNAYQVGNLMLESAGDHAFALARLLVEPVPTVAPWTCTRGALEASAMSCWLLAADVTARERVCRSFAYRYETLREQQKLARSTRDQASLERIAHRMDEVGGKAVALGFQRLQDKNGRLTGIGRAMPTTTDQIREAFGQETLFRIFSAMAHSQSTALVQLGFLSFDEALPTLLKKGMNADAATVLLMTAADSLAKPTWAKARLYGLSMKRLANVLGTRYSEMGLNQSRWFWRDEGPS